MRSLDVWNSPTIRLVCVGLILGWGVAHSASTANYDTAWTLVYDGGKSKSGLAIPDRFNDVKVLPSGDFLCVGESRDSTFLQNVLLLKVSPAGKIQQKKLVGFNQGSGASSALISRTGNIIVGGRRDTSPLLMKLDTALNVKSSTWYYDSAANRMRLRQGAAINAMVESASGRIRAAAGDRFPDNDGQDLNNYAAYLEFDTSGSVKGFNEWKDVTGYEVAGWSIAGGESGGILLGGKQALFFLDTNGVLGTQNQYSFTVPGTGTQLNNVARARELRNGSVMVVGQSYEEDCWTRYGRLYFDAWWSILASSGGAGIRNVAGVSGANDYVFDLAQLADGKIAFVGGKGTSPDSAIWVFVTDSTGKTLLWEKQYNLPGLKDGLARANVFPASIAATPDSGFVVAGYEPGAPLNDDACIFKFSPKAGPEALRPTLRPMPRGEGAWTFEFNAPPGPAEFQLFDMQGRSVARYRKEVKRAGPVRFNVEALRLPKGIFFWRFQSLGQASQGRILF